jgi:hypothetical protein
MQVLEANALMQVLEANVLREVQLELGWVIRPTGLLAKDSVIFLF